MAQKNFKDISINDDTTKYSISILISLPLLTRIKTQLSFINNFVFEDEFVVNTVAIEDSTHDHWMAKLANYQGFPLVLGGFGGGFWG